MRTSGANGFPSRPAVAMAVLLAAFAGCARAPEPAAKGKLPEVMVALPVERAVLDNEEFTGRTDAKRNVTVRARVSGYLQKVCFTEGADVKEGDVLFEIDPRPFRAEFDRADASVHQSEANLHTLTSNFKRANSMFTRGAIGQEEYDKIVGDRDAMAAQVKLATAQRDTAKLNLDWTKVLSPLGGRISRQLIDPGNLVKADDTALTTIVSLDPIYVYFDVDERTLLTLRRLRQQGKSTSYRDAPVPVYLGLSDEEGFPHAGTINFADNQVDPMTGTLKARGEFPNPGNLLSPGLFARIKLPIGTPHKATLVAERALGTEQGQRFVYVVNDKNEVEYRKVKLGALQGGLAAVEDGVKMGERVVVNGLQRVRQGSKVEVKVVPMPGAEPAADKAPVTAGKAPAGDKTPAADKAPPPAGPPVKAAKGG
jgi:RND family efflux transporter MFP subunit